MLFLITGTDTYAREQAVKERVDQFLEPEFAEFNLEKYDLPVEVAPVFDAWITPPFWGERRVVVTQLNSDGLAQLCEIITTHANKDFAPTNVLIMVADSLDKRRKAVKAVLKLAKEHIHCEELKRWNAHKILGPWLQAEVKKEGKQINPDAVEYLINACGTDRHLLASALEKVLLYVDTESRITLAVVRKLVTQTESDIFLWLELISRRDHTAAFQQFHALLLRDNPNRIMSTLGSSLTRLYRTRFYAMQGRSQQDIAKALGMNPYVVKMDLQRWQRFSLEKITHSMQYLLDLQTRSRSSRLKPELALEMWLGDILSA